ncbi:glycosyltransferase [Erysipelothrix sp. HDW6C]|uniref:CPCC family cysteine-rich protein n=1 Tax=Erysipelothrix sp. HDW6C TaxID=2714930 RepID=UPI00140BC28E|nr:CPCC family cysteine-rich protein [Erysipelothrix sp. HDW6C]QIK70243.1 glycosyltransferase [Erysipelothrix sp. HDW6C]
MKRIQCPCCLNFTIEDFGCEVIVDICSVCFWQYDIIGQNKVDIAIGPNKVSLVEARINYKKFGSSSERLLPNVRDPHAIELPENN